MSIPSWAVRGARVVCIDGNWAYPQDYRVAVPVKGETYTIREIEDEGFRFVELPNRAYAFSDGFKEPRFHYAFFRPFVSRTQEDDLATHFEQYLKTDHRAPEKADA